MADISPKEAAGGCLTAVIVAVILAAVIAVVTVVGWQAGWWFTNQDIKRTNQAIQHGYANQSGQLAALANDIQTFNGITVQMDGASGQQFADLKAQRLGAANDACKAAAQITISLGADAAWVKRNCDGPAVSATSPLRK